MTNFIVGINPEDLPIYWRNEATGKLAKAVEAYFLAYADGPEYPVPEMEPEHMELISGYLMRHLAAPLYWNNPDASAENLAALRRCAIAASQIKTRGDLTALIEQMLDIGIDPF